MKTSVECLARADEIDALRLACHTEFVREEFAALAREWRKVALIARKQEAWAVLHPDAEVEVDVPATASCLRAMGATMGHRMTAC